MTVLEQLRKTIEDGHPGETEKLVREALKQHIPAGRIVQPASPSADLHPPLHATTAARYGNFFFTAIFSTSFHMVFRSEEDYIVFHHSI